MTLAIGWYDTNGDICLAADRCVLTEDHGKLEDGKIFTIKNLTIAFAGDVIVEHALRHSFWGNTEMPDVPTEMVCAYWYDTIRPVIERACPEATYQVIVTDGKELFVSMDGLLRREQRTFVAIGEAAWFAYGFAMGVYACDQTYTANMRGLFILASTSFPSVSPNFDIYVAKHKPKKQKRKAKKKYVDDDGWEFEGEM